VTPEKDTKITTKEAWEPMQISYVGDARELIQGGGGKVTATGGDPGEQRKQTPSGPG